MMEKGHNGWYIALLVFNIVTLIAVFVFNGLSGAGNDNGLFVTTQTKQADKYKLEITPAGWTFSIWGVIYAWQCLWILYSVVNVFRRTEGGEPLYNHPYLLPPVALGLYAVANGCNIAWCFLFDRSHVQAAFGALFLVSLLLILSLAACSKRLHDARQELQQAGRRRDVWLARTLLHNGLGVYAAWTSIAALLNLAMVMTYTAGSDVTMTTACTAALGILAAELLVYVLTDLCLCDRYLRYTVTPYLVVVVALVGVLTNNWDDSSTNSIFTAVLLGAGGLALLIKVTVTLVRHCRDRRSSQLNL